MSILIVKKKIGGQRPPSLSPPNLALQPASTSGPVRSTLARARQRDCSDFVRVLGDRGTGRTVLPDGTDRFRSPPQSQLWRMAKIVSFEADLRCRRLRWCQDIVRYRRDHLGIIAAVLGRSQCDLHETLDTCGRITLFANPWARQWASDINSLNGYTTFATFCDLYDGELGHFFSGSPEHSELVVAFVCGDPREMRAALLTVSVPPPGLVETASEPAELTDEELLPFLCGLQHAEGRCLSPIRHQKNLITTPSLRPPSTQHSPVSCCYSSML